MKKARSKLENLSVFSDSARRRVDLFGARFAGSRFSTVKSRVLGRENFGLEKHQAFGYL
jgi:hypothetical protein